MKINFRDRLPVFLFILGVTILIIILTNVLSASVKLHNNSTGTGNSGGYTWCENLLFVPDSDFQIEPGDVIDTEIYQGIYQEALPHCKTLFQILEDSSFATGINNIFIEVGGGYEEDVTLIFSDAESPGRTLEKGEFSKMGEESAVYIGEAIKALCVEEEGALYLKIGDELVPVKGILKNTTFEEDRTILLYYKGLSDKTKKYIAENYTQMLTDIAINSSSSDISADAAFFVGSNTAETDAETARLIDEMKKSGLSGVEKIDLTANTADFSKNLLSYARLLLTVIVGLFSLGNLVQVTFLWIERKRQNIVICRAFGMKDGRLLRGLLSEAAVLLLISYALSLIAELVLYGAGRNVGLINVLEFSTAAFLFIALPVFLIVAAELFYLKKQTVAMVLQKD